MLCERWKGEKFNISLLCSCLLPQISQTVHASHVSVFHNFTDIQCRSILHAIHMYTIYIHYTVHINHISKLKSKPQIPHPQHWMPLSTDITHTQHTKKRTFKCKTNEGRISGGSKHIKRLVLGKLNIYVQL